MAEKKTKNRTGILICTCVNTFCFGGLYAWSAFSGEMAEFMGWDYSKVSFAYSLQLIVLVLMGIVGGSLLQKLGPRKLITLSGIMWGLGWLLTGFSTNLVMLYIVFGVLTGTASSFGYNPCVVTAVRWYPDKKGFASGMTVGVCGIASFFVAPFANMLLTRFDVMTAFKIVGAIFLIMSLATTWYLANPDEDWKPEGFEAPATENNVGRTWKEMLKDPVSYVLWATLLFASVGGLMMIGHASKIGQEVAGMTSAQAAMLVGIMAVANFAGRLVLGMLSDKIGRYNIIIITMLVGAVDMLLMAKTGNYMAFIVAIVIVSLCFSGTLAIYSALTSDVFGPKYNGINFSIIFTGYGVAGVVGPVVANFLHSTAGNYNSAFIFSAVCSFLAAVLGFAAKKMVAKRDGCQTLGVSIGMMS